MNGNIDESLCNIGGMIRCGCGGGAINIQHFLNKH